MEQRFGIIDLGSNTCRLVIFACDTQRSFRLIDQVSERVRIGEGMFDSQRLQERPMARAIELLRMYAELCRANEIVQVTATATSAVRDAQNGPEFLGRVTRDTGLVLRVLSGEEEAYYAYLGAINSLSFSEGVVADLGGGSLELMRVEGRLPVAFASLPLGAVRLAEQFLGVDPIPRSDARHLAEYIDAALDSVPWLSGMRGQELVALGGSVRALAHLNQIADGYPLDRLHAYALSRQGVRVQRKALFKRGLAERKSLPGLQSERADVLPAGVLVMDRLMRFLRADTLTVSGQGLREGLFYEQYFGGDAAHPPVVSDVRALSLANTAMRYHVEWGHALQVCALALALFDQTRKLHRLGPADRYLLGAAALLHDVGVTIDYYRHHRHGAYIVENTDLPGFSHREIALISLLLRWHRRGQPSLEPFAALLAPGDLQIVRKLAAFLRLAEDLERSRTQVVQRIECVVSDDLVEIRLYTRGAEQAELWAATRKTDLLRSALGCAVQITRTEGDANDLATLARDYANTMVLERAAQIANHLKELYAKDTPPAPLSRQAHHRGGN